MNDVASHNNRLGAETSPYLLQHRHNPVDWWPWGPAALAEARRSHRPVLLSIGYAACHWCHVMAHESFEDPATAAVMNELFVNIKVDREERPDIDQIYMAALHHLGQQGGWPLTMFLTPDGAPFWGGTYFPKQAQYGRPGFTDVLHEVARVFRDSPDKVDQNRQALVARLAERATASTPATIAVADLDRAATSIAAATDPVNGGLRGAPKFPQCAMLEFLWRAGARTGDDRFFITTNLALTRINQGGIYDHLGGGYSRYSVDERWLVPHFEKMLYDNAQLLDLLALEQARAPNALYAGRAAETVGWVSREMLQKEGGLSSSLDADSEGEEGKFYVWSANEVTDILGPENAALFAAAYGVTPDGNFEGQNILNRLNSMAYPLGNETNLAMLRQMLHEERSKRIPPGLDDKVLADWNGLTVAALAHAATAFEQPDWLALARRVFGFVAATMTRGDRLGHSWRDGYLLFPGLASDFAAMIRAALALFEAAGEADFLKQAIAWQGALDAYYADRDHGGYYLTADDAEGLIVRPHATVDDAIPNHNGLIAENLVRLAVLSGDERFRKQSDALFAALLPAAQDNVFGHLSLLNALDLKLNGAEIVIVGDGHAAGALLAAARRLPHATRTVLHVPNAAALPNDHPARAKADKTDKVESASGAAAFVCRGQSCSRPVADAESLRKLAMPTAFSSEAETVSPGRIEPGHDGRR